MSIPSMRIQKEIRELDLPYVRSIAPRQNPLLYDVYLSGPMGTEYYQKVFHILVEFPESYPFLPPTVTFLSEVQLRGVDPMSGKLMLRILNPKFWNIVNTLTDVLTCLYYVFKTEMANDVSESETESDSDV